MDVRMVDVGEVRLACRVSGNPAGAPVVLLHALGAAAAGWETVARDLGRHHRIYAPDLRGHGDSGQAGPCSFGLLRDDLGLLLESLGLERVSLVGHSTGGVVAYLYAAKHPERVERLVLEEVPPPEPFEEPVPRPGGEFLAPLYAELAAPAEDWRAGLDAITAPVLVLAGGLRSHLPQDRIAAMAHRFGDGCLVTIPCGHDIHTARPVEFTQTLAGFLPGAFGTATGTGIGTGSGSGSGKDDGDSDGSRHRD